ncbi:hypothetical protein [Saccharopolyspora sp. NPDC049357]|uniref:hypothetical protein n=1 Tax=Saccharopolyspora sp. NPDC049357 TaxID=3154507 RepID=UPI003447EB3D
MFPLDPRTIERIAAIVVDTGGHYERKGWQLEQLFSAAGWVDPPEYDGSPRVPWVVEQLTERSTDRSAIERFLCRICDPLEYDEGKPAADVFCQIINEKLQPERLAITYISGRPVLGELTDDGGEPMFVQPPNLDQRLRGLIESKTTVDVLVKRAKEADICASSGAHTLAIIGIGSFVEGMLLALLIERDREIRENGFPAGKNGKHVTPQRAGLELLINTARSKNWIQFVAADFMHRVRDYRNFVHPGKELAELPDFDQESVRLCWAPVHVVLNDLEERLTRVGG